MKKKKPMLELYERFEKEGLITNYDLASGLCPIISEIDRTDEGRESYSDQLELFKPTDENLEEFEINRYNHPTKTEGRFWASGDAEPRQGEFTDLRKTILLFLAVMNDEL